MSCPLTEEDVAGDVPLDYEDPAVVIPGNPACRVKAQGTLAPELKFIRCLPHLTCLLRSSTGAGRFGR